MVLTETINYHTNHLGAIRTNKDRLKYECNVGIVITKKFVSTTKTAMNIALISPNTALYSKKMECNYMNYSGDFYLLYRIRFTRSLSKPQLVVLTLGILENEDLFF